VIRKGDICWFRFSSPDKRRPVIVLGRDDVLPSLAQVPVVPLSTRIRNLPWELVLTEEDGVPESCAVKVEWIRIVERRLLGNRIASFPEHRWSELRASLLCVLGLDEA
jgi:mRNA interferase MazF